MKKINFHLSPFKFQLLPFTFHLTSYIILLTSSIIILSSCGSVKNVAYLQNSDSIFFASSEYLYDARIMPKDQLTITVNTTNPEVSVP